MANGRTKDDFLEFMDFLADKGLLTKATAQARKASANKVFAILEPEEALDVTQIDLDEVMYRFGNLQGQNYKPKSLQVYKSRIRSALDDFESYKNNPLGFKPSLQSKTKTPKKSGTPNEGDPKVVDMARPADPPPPGSSSALSRISSEILPIPIREGLTVQIAHLPFDLTKAEATKIANIILAHATPDD